MTTLAPMTAVGLRALVPPPLPLTEQADGGIRCGHFRIRLADSLVLVTLSNPPANALSAEMLDGVSQLCDLVANEAVRAVIVTGEGSSFSVGADLRGLPAITRADLRRCHSLLDQIGHSLVPWIAAINGHCLGGGLELALACHLRIANSRARFAFPEVSLGLIPGMGATYRLPRLVGSARACELILTGRTIKADEALAMGLVNVVTAPADVLPVAERLARRIAAKSPAAVRAALSCLNRSGDGDVTAALIETECFERLARTPEVRRTLQELGADLGERRNHV